MSQILGLMAAVIMGGVLGLMGGGGAILTVPILVYLFGIAPLAATGASLLIVGLASLMGVFSHWRAGTVRFRQALPFALAAIAGVVAMRNLILPAMPEIIWRQGALQLSRDMLIMFLFGLAMLLSARSMLRRDPETQPEDLGEGDWLQLAGLGLGTGLFAGLVGAGGGFIIVPVLVRWARMPVKIAIGTSLTIISLQSLSGFAADLLKHPRTDWGLLLAFSALAGLGVLLGSWFSSRVPANKLKPAFGWFILAMGLFVLISTSLHH